MKERSSRLQILTVRADALAIGKIRPHQLVLVHNDRELAINPQQHEQVRGRNQVRKMKLHRVPSENGEK